MGPAVAMAATQVVLEEVGKLSITENNKSQNVMDSTLKSSNSSENLNKDIDKSMFLSAMETLDSETNASSHTESSDTESLPRGGVMFDDEEGYYESDHLWLWITGVPVSWSPATPRPNGFSTITGLSVRKLSRQNLGGRRY